MSHLDALIDAPGPKKLLSIDGGGIRGLIAIEMLARVEALLRDELKRPELRLCEYFDYVGGTSTGAIIAMLVALGYTMNEIRAQYRVGAHTMFDPNVLQRVARHLPAPLSVVVGVLGMLLYRAMYDAKPLERQIKRIAGDDTTLGAQRLATLLMVVMRNESTDSPWTLSNNPRAMYNRRGADGGPSNLDLPLWQLVRASTAAPVYFPSERIEIPGVAKPFVFMDGGITVYNNPAFQLFLMATMPEYEVKWKAGAQDVLLLSVGTGFCESANLDLRLRDMSLLYSARSTPAALIRGATVEQDMLCRLFGKTVADCGLSPIDSEIGTLVENASPLSEKLFTYARYNVELSATSLAQLGLYDPNASPPGIDPRTLQPLDSVEYLDELERVGRAAAERCVRPEHFGGFLFARQPGRPPSEGGVPRPQEGVP